MMASHSSASLCEKPDEGSPMCLGDQAPSPSLNFDCSICLELPHEPVVTMCGHLFCWSCLHRWITIQPVFQECPVCKAGINGKVIPLYGRGKIASAGTHAKTDHSFDVPRRPSAQQTYVPAANVPQSTGFQHQRFNSQETYGNRSGHSMHSVTASGLFPALFGIQMITSQEYNGGSSFGTAFSAPSRLLVGATTPQQQRLNAQQESVLYWFLILLGCFACVCFLLF